MSSLLQACYIASDVTDQSRYFTSSSVLRLRTCDAVLSVVVMFQLLRLVTPSSRHPWECDLKLVTGGLKQKSCTWSLTTLIRGCNLILPMP